MAVSAAELAKKVREMRAAQAKYFSDRKSDSLAAAVRLEKQVDRLASRVIDGESESEAAAQGELFPAGQG